MVLAQGIPNFLLAILLILLFGVRLRWLPTGGRGTWPHLILPAVVLSFILLPLTVRVTRATMLDVIGRAYVRTARSKGSANRWCSAATRSGTPRCRFSPSSACRRPPSWAARS